MGSPGQLWSKGGAGVREEDGAASDRALGWEGEEEAPGTVVSRVSVLCCQIEMGCQLPM